MKQLKLNLTFLLMVLMSMVGARASAQVMPSASYDIEVANADGVTIFYRWISGMTELSVSYCGGNYSGNVVIPSSVTYGGKEYSVTSIGESAFRNCSGLTSVTIPNSVTSIGNSAFSCCYGLTSVTIPNSVTSIGEYAFLGCSGLTSVEIPNSVTSIGEDAFYGTAWFDNQPDGVVYAGKVAYAYKGTMPENTHIELMEGTVGIAGKAFYYCSRLTSVTIPNSVTSIGNSAFGSCSGLTSVEIPNSVTSIGYQAFSYCSALTKIEVASDNTTYDSRDNCNAIIETASNTLIAGCQSTIIPNSVTSIGNYAFYKCSGLTSVTIPNSVTSIGESAFEYCSGLTSVTIPNSVTRIGFAAFSGCDGLKKVIVKDIAVWCNIQFGSNPLSYAHHLYSDENTEITDLVIPNGVTSIGGSAFYGCDGLTSVTIPNSVTSIGNYAFRGCSGLTSVTIPNSVTSIGEDAFSGCSGLKKVIVKDIAAWCNIQFGNYGNPLYYAHHLYSDENTEITDLVIPNSVTSIGEYAFLGCSGLTSVEIPNSVTSIGSGAFHGTAWFDNQPYGVVYAGKVAYTYKGTMPENTHIELMEGTVGIAGKAFYYCSRLTSVEIPNSVTSIGKAAFGSCSGLTSVEIPNSVTSIGSSAFYYCSGLTSVTIGNSVTSIGKWAFYGCDGLKKVIVKDIAAWCNIKFGEFDNSDNSDSNPLYYAHHLYSDENTEITDLVIPNGVTSIGNYAFCGCSGLTSVTIPNSVTNIGDDAFSECSGLTSVTIPNSVTSIGSGAFWYCSGLTSVEIPNSVTSIGNYAFYGCSGLTSVEIPNSVTSIGYDAFEDCYGLTSVTSLIEEPFDIGTYRFSYDTYKNATLYVPAGTKEKYEATKGWKDFTNIVEKDDMGIDAVDAQPNSSADTPVYNLNGQRVNVPVNGIFIKNGRKVLVK